MALYHVNFHTAYNRPVFEQQEYDAAIRALLREAMRRHRVLCACWEVMPTHVHLIVADFPDLPLGTAVGRLKGSASHAFFQAYPFLREDLLGGHLWSKGYFATLIRSHRQFSATVDYIRQNRANAGLEAPAPLTYFP